MLNGEVSEKNIPFELRCPSIDDYIPNPPVSGNSIPEN